MQSSLIPKIIEDKILENYAEYSNLFIAFQSELLAGLYRRYQSIENGHLVLYFAKKVHQGILRQKDFDLNFDISFEKFWKNHNEITIERTSIIGIAEATSLPKETARRKILQLIKQKVLNKKNKNIGWLPNEQYKQSYNLFIYKEIEQMTKLIKFVCDKIDLNYSSEEIIKEIKDKFSFFWFHYLGVELEYLKIWNGQLKDLELLFIGLQLTSLLSLRAKEKKISYKSIHEDPHVIKDFDSIDISATSVSEVTGISRATCVRKLQQLVKLKMITQDKISKRFYITPEAVLNNLAPKQATERVVKIFSEYFFIFIRALSIKT